MEQLSLFEYQDIKNKIKTKLNETVNNFVLIGFYLKQVRDSALYTQDGYKNMEEFARGEFNIAASTASRFMDINTRFSEDGNSQILKQEYANFGYSKLQEMLTVKDEDLGLITEDTTVKQIRELKTYEKQEDKAAVLEEQGNLPIVQMAAEEEKEEVAISQEDPFHEVMQKYWEQHMDTLKLVHNNMISPADLAETLCPSGSKTFWHGIYMVFFYDMNGGIKVRYYKDGTPQIDTYTYAEWMEKTNEVITDEVLAKILVVEKKPEPKKAVEEPKKEWKKPELEVKEQEKDKVPVPEVVVRKAEELDNKPLPGQMTTNDIPELNEGIEEETAVVVEEEQPEIIEGEYRELKPQNELPSLDELTETLKYYAKDMQRNNEFLKENQKGALRETAIKQNTRYEVVIRALRYCIRQQEA